MRNSRRLLTGWAAAMLAMGVTMARADEQLVTLKYVGTDVRKAISLLQTVSDLRVVVNPKVPSKRITLSLKDVPPEDALRTVVASAGLSCRKVGNGFVVEPKRAEKREADANKGPAPDRPVDLQQHEAAGLGGIVVPGVPSTAPSGPALRSGEREAGVEVAPAVLEALERPVDVDVKNSALSAVTEQISHSAGLKVSADPTLAAGMVVTIGLHGIPLKAALELVAGQTGLQISPRPDGVAFVQPGLSLDRAQARLRSAPANARRVDQGQLWTSEWAKVLTSGISAASELPAQRSLRRQPVNPDGHPFEFKPRSGNLRQSAPVAAPVPEGRAAGQATGTGAGGGTSDPPAAAAKVQKAGSALRAAPKQAKTRIKKSKRTARRSE